MNLGTIQRRFAWQLRKDDTHTSRCVNIICNTTTTKHDVDSEVVDDDDKSLRSGRVGLDMTRLDSSSASSSHT